MIVITDIRLKYYSHPNQEKKLPVGSCLLEAAGLQDDRILQYSFLRVPKGGKEEYDQHFYECLTLLAH